MPYGFVRIFYFLFFRRQGFRMIIFDRQAGPLQNFNRSHAMVIGRSVSFSDPRDPRVGVGRPKHPKPPPPPPEKNLCMRFRTPGTFLTKNTPPPNFFVFCLRFKTTGRCFCGKKIQLLKTSTPQTPTPPPSPQNTHLNPGAIISTPTIAV